ncbi:MAG TPA: PTS sugar transporter subunit IIA, partial [Elusimicrobiales bacterium]|nr:PTS sugar transporter subunit IIA [Elusimicrobiales bacterium]
SLICDSFVKEATELNIHQTERFKALKHIVYRLHSIKPVFDRIKTAQLIETREKMLSCALGHETAFPHARIEDIETPIITFAKSKQGIIFPSLDKKPVKLIFLILVPMNSPTFQLQILSQLSLLVSNETLRARLLEVKTSEDVSKIINAFENRVALP